MFHNWKKSVINLTGLAVLVILSNGCTKQQAVHEDPKHRLTEYISKSFAINNVGEREQLASYLTGEAKARLVAWSDDQFRQAFIDSRRQFLKLAFTEVKNISPEQVNITYELTYVDPTKGHETKVTNKKLCELTEEQGKWLISDVHNIKELIEYTNEMTLP